MMSLFSTNFSEVRDFIRDLKERAFQFRDSPLVPLYDFGKSNASWLNERIDFLIHTVNKLDSSYCSSITFALKDIQNDVSVLALEVDSANRGHKESRGKIPIYAGKIYNNILTVDRYVQALKKNSSTKSKL